MPKFLATAALLAFAGWVHAAVPTPADTPAQVVVAGRTSTAGDIKVVHVGEEIPATFAGSKVHNTPGFTWWVSQHFALKTDCDPGTAESYLTVLELAYPHYVALFGAEPDGIRTQRFAVVFGASLESADAAFRSDGFSNLGGGGFTSERNAVPYAYPSGSLEYHRRYILLHECTHAYDYVLHGPGHAVPNWCYEGMADSLSHHVYDAGRRQLTVHVLDKAAENNWYDQGLRALRANPGLTPEEVNRSGAERGVRFLMIMFFNTDPERAQKFRLWREEMVRAAAQGSPADAGAGLQSVFGPWSGINAGFKEWVARRRRTFHYVEWGWEQDGDTLWSYGFAKGGKRSQTDVNLPPGEAPKPDPLVMDYPHQPPSALVGPIARGGAAPTVGCLVDFSRNPGRGEAGFGLGVVNAPEPGAGFLKLLIVKEATLLIDGSDCGMEARTVSLPEPLLQAMAAGGHLAGITAKIAANQLQITVKAQAPNATATVFRASAPITPPQRARFLKRPATILARDGRHGVTPYFDIGPRTEPDLRIPAPPNRWRNPGDAQLRDLYAAARQLGRHAPESLLRRRRAMTLAAGKDGPERQAALRGYDADLARMTRDIRACGANPESIAGALADLRGVRPDRQATPGTAASEPPRRAE